MPLPARVAVRRAAAIGAWGRGITSLVPALSQQIQGLLQFVNFSSDMRRILSASCGCNSEYVVYMRLSAIQPAAMLSIVCRGSVSGVLVLKESLYVACQHSDCAVLLIPCASLAGSSGEMHHCSLCSRLWHGSAVVGVALTPCCASSAAGMAVGHQAVAWQSVARCPCLQCLLHCARPSGPKLVCHDTGCTVEKSSWVGSVCCGKAALC